MQLQDTLSNKEQTLDISKKIKIYLCGVTVYDESHIGHARTIIVFDVLRKYLESKKAEVEFIQNFTDVDEKIINRATTENVSAQEISDKYIKNTQASQSKLANTIPLEYAAPNRNLRQIFYLGLDGTRPS